MAIIPVRNTFKGTGSQTVFTYTFALLGSYSSVVVKTIAVGSTEKATQVEGAAADYTHNKDSKQITFNTAPASGVTVIIQRSTLRDRPVDYIGGSAIGEKDLDDDANRLTSVDQELEAGVLDALQKNAEGDAWDGEGLATQNFGPAVVTTGLPTLGQVQNLIAGGETAVVDNATVIILTGDGTATEFKLPGIKGVIRAQLIVTVENVLQSVDPNDPAYSVLNEEDSDYPVAGDGSDFIKFTTAPVNLAEIEVRAIQGTVSAIISAGLIDSAQIANNAVGTQHINVGSGVATRFNVFDDSGDPTARVIVHGDVSDFDAGVRENRLDQMAKPTASVDFNTQKMLGIVAGLANTDGVNLQQVNSLISAAIKTNAGVVSDVDMAAAGFLGINSNVTISVGFIPSVFIFQCRTHTSSFGKHSFWVFVFHGSDTTVSGFDFHRQQRDGVMRVTCSAAVPTGTTNIRFEQISGNGDASGAWVNAGWIAIQIGGGP